MLQVSMTSFDSVSAAALMSLMFVICHTFSRRRHSQNRRFENATFIESFISKKLNCSFWRLHSRYNRNIQSFQVCVTIAVKKRHGMNVDTQSILLDQTSYTGRFGH